MQGRWCVSAGAGVLLAVAVAVAVTVPLTLPAAAAPGRQAAAAGAGGWRRAEEVPQSGILNAGGEANVLSVSCGSAGICTAGGFYTDGSGHMQAFVATSRNGRWGRAKEATGTAALNTGGDARISSVSCATADNCTAGGYYTDGSGDQQALVAYERDGRWQRAKEVPGTAELDGGGDASVSSLSCHSAGNCTAGGTYFNGTIPSQPFVVTQHHGRWGTAEPVPGLAALNAGGDAEVFSVSCAGTGDCVAAGVYRDAADHPQAFVVIQQHGRWGSAEEVPGTAALNAGGDAQVNAVSCALPGDCVAGGSFLQAAGHFQAFVVTLKGGRWGNAEQVPGTKTLNAGGNARINAVACPLPGNCAAGGFYTDAARTQQAFVVTERRGIWGPPQRVPGTKALNAGGNADINAVSCAAAGDCAAGGYYADAADHHQAMLVTEPHYTWGRAERAPGTGTLNTGGYAYIDSVSCAPAGNCAAGGSYTLTDLGGPEQALVDSKSP